MLSILLSWFIIILSFLCFGDLLIRIWNKVTKQNEDYSFTDSFWIGLATITSILCAISLFIPLNIYVLSTIVCISIFYWICKWRILVTIYKSGRNAFKELSVWFKIIISLLFIISCLYSLLIPSGYDIGLYHIQSMMWNGEYSIIPGLGNLHGRFAFNSSSLLLYTIFFHHPDYFAPNFSINGLCFFIFSFWMIRKANISQGVIKIAAIYFFLVVFYFTFCENLSSSSTDLFVNILIAYLLFRAVFKKDSIQKDFLFYLLIPVFCITLKVSSSFIVLFTLVSIFYAIKNKRYYVLYASIILGLVIITPWLTRFVILSGYLIYPFPAIDIFNFDWKMPIEQAINEKNSISTWAKTYTMKQSEVINMPIYEWLPVWFVNLSKLHAISYILVLVSPILMIYSSIKKRNNPYLTAWIVAFSGCLFGFITAPDPRFSLSFILCSVCIALCSFDDISIEKFKSIFTNRHLQTGTHVFFFMCLSYYLINGFKDITDYQGKETPFYTLIYKPQSFYYVPRILNISYDAQPMQNTIIYIPIGRDQCYEQCIPCTPYYNPNLVMRGESLEDGFKIKQ